MSGRVSDRRQPTDTYRSRGWLGRGSSAPPLGWAASSTPGPPSSLGLKRPDLRCLGPCSASHVALRAASSRISSSQSSTLVVLLVAKSKSAIVAEPMIPPIDERLVDG